MSRIMDDINHANNAGYANQTSVASVRPAKVERYKTVKVPTKHYGLRLIRNIIICLVVSTIYTFTCKIPVWDTFLEIVLTINFISGVKNLWGAIKKAIIRLA